MSYENVKQYFVNAGLECQVKKLDRSSATVELAAEAIGCRPGQIAKTMSFLLEDKPVLIVTAGDARVDNAKYKAAFHQKARMIPRDAVEEYVGHAPGGVCPFAVRPGVAAYLDISLKRFETVYPAAGDASSAVELSLDELETHSAALGWVDVCRDWEQHP
ncbi:MAG: YbaK/EbsC family protein [Kineothrix sp.]